MEINKGFYFHEIPIIQCYLKNPHIYKMTLSSIFVLISSLEKLLSKTWVTILQRI